MHIGTILASTAHPNETRPKGLNNAVRSEITTSEHSAVFQLSTWCSVSAHIKYTYTYDLCIFGINDTIEVNKLVVMNNNRRLCKIDVGLCT
jgi:hypothetical protein